MCVCPPSRALRRLLATLFIVSAAAAKANGPTPPAAEAPRHALVIGHSKYVEVAALPNVANDLDDVCAALGRLRFRVRCVANLPTRQAFLDTVQAFVNQVPPGANAMIYYAGHAVQVGGENYLIPSAASAKVPGGWLPQFVRLSELFQLSERARAGFQFIVLDACRENPDAEDPEPNGRTAPTDISASRAGREALRSLLSSVRGGNRFATYGIAAVRDAPPNTLVLFATGAGTAAFDGTGERNGPLTKHLLLQMQRPQQQIDQAIKNVIQAVADDTERRYRQRQSPSLYGTFSGEFCFDGCPQLLTPRDIEQEKERAARAAQEERERERREAERKRRENGIVPAL
jgi:uncharacterized caspase-like protein